MYMNQVIDLVQSPSPDTSDVPHQNQASNGEFFIKTTYEMLSNRINSEDSLNSFGKNWKCKGPTRIRYTLWKTVHGRLLTIEERVIMLMMTSSIKCDRCMEDPELII